MSDNDTTSTQTAATAIALISNMVQLQLIQAAKLMFTVQDESARANKGAKSIAFPRAGDLDPVTVTEGVDQDAQALTYASDTLTLDQQFQTFLRLTDKADMQSVVDVELDIISRAGKGMAKSFDTYIYGLLKAGASASAPDHIVNHYGSSGTLTLAKVLEARKLLDQSNVPDGDRFMAINPDQEAQVLAINTFTDAEKYGSSQGRQNGEIGRLYGFTVIKSNVVEDNVSLYYHRTALAFAQQVMPKWETFRNLKRLAWEYSLSTLYGAKVLDSGKRHVVANTTGS